MDDVEKLAEEIEEKCSIEGWKDSNGRGCDSCICSEKVARFILRREIAARMDELTKHISGSQEACLHKLERIAELRKHLTKIGE